MFIYCSIVGVFVKANMADGMWLRSLSLRRGHGILQIDIILLNGVINCYCHTIHDHQVFSTIIVQIQSTVTVLLGNHSNIFCCICGTCILVMGNSL